MNIFEEVKKLELPLGQYIVLGSGILGALGIRDIGDVDLLVSPLIFEKLKTDGWEYEEVEIEGRVREKLSRDFVEIYKDFWYGGKSQFSMDMISEAEIIDGVPFLSLLKLREIKEAMSREKDKRDILLIDEYLS